MSAVEMVTIGNAGNTTDTTGCGRVDYTYSIGKFEVTAGEHRGFLNAVAASDPYGLYHTSMALTHNTGSDSGIAVSAWRAFLSPRPSSP